MMMRTSAYHHERFIAEGALCRSKLGRWKWTYYSRGQAEHYLRLHRRSVQKELEVYRCPHEHNPPDRPRPGDDGFWHLRSKRSAGIL